METEHKKLRREWVSEVFSASHGKRRGVAILLNRNVVFSVEKVLQDTLGRYVRVIGTISGMVVSIINIYAPAEDDYSFFRDIAIIITENAKGMIILGSDFNAVLDGRLDRLPDEYNQTKKYIYIE